MLTINDLSGNGKGVGFVNRAESNDEFTNIGGGTPARVRGQFNVSLTGDFVATFRLERSYDNGLSWNPVTALGTSIEFEGPCEEVFEENEPTVTYRWYCLAFTSGLAIGRISQ